MSALRRLELRGPASDEALFSVLSSESATAGGAGEGGAGDDIDADQILGHLKTTGELQTNTLIAGVEGMSCWVLRVGRFFCLWSGVWGWVVGAGAMGLVEPMLKR